MAPPRLFVSSTFYDLRFVRAELDALEAQMGIQLVRFETGDIPYQTAGSLPESCCKEIDNCNILVVIIGGRYGSVVHDKSHSGDQESHVSVSQLEVRRAVKSGLLLFTFVDASVYAQYPTYLANEARANEIQWAGVDSIRVFEFIKEIHGIPGSPVFSFRNAQEIEDMLRIQLAGVFQDLLARQKLAAYAGYLDQLIKSAERLNELQRQVSAQGAEAAIRMQSMLLPDDRLYERVRESLGLAFRVFFRNEAELEALLTAQGFVAVNANELSEALRDRRWYLRKDPRLFLSVARKCFSDEGTVRAGVAAMDGSVIWTGVRMAR